MTKPAAKPVAWKPDPATGPTWGDYNPYFPGQKAVSKAQSAPNASMLNRSNSPYFPILPSASRG